MPKHKRNKGPRKITGKRKVGPKRTVKARRKAKPMPTREQLDALDEEVVRVNEHGGLECDLHLGRIGPRATIKFADMMPGLFTTGEALALDAIDFREAAKYLSQAVVPDAHDLSRWLVGLADQCERAVSGFAPKQPEGPQENYEAGPEPGDNRTSDG